MMKALIPAAVIASVLTAPTFAFAQSNAPKTRAEVRAELVQLERAGYNPASDQTQYPKNIQAAEARVAAQNAASSSYGGAAAGSTASGSPVSARPAADGGVKSIYFGS